MPGDDAVVSYTIKELIGNVQHAVDAGFARVETKLDSKADKAELVALTARVDAHGHEIGQLKDRQRDDETAGKALETARTKALSSRQWAVGILISAIIAAVGIAEVVH